MMTCWRVPNPVTLFFSLLTVVLSQSVAHAGAGVEVSLLTVFARTDHNVLDDPSGVAFCIHKTLSRKLALYWNGTWLRGSTMLFHTFPTIGSPPPADTLTEPVTAKTRMYSTELGVQYRLVAIRNLSLRVGFGLSVNNYKQTETGQVSGWGQTYTDRKLGVSLSLSLHLKRIVAVPIGIRLGVRTKSTFDPGATADVLTPFKNHITISEVRFGLAYSL